MRAATLPHNFGSADAYYNLGGETSIDGLGQRNADNTLRHTVN
jgi:hypothetical protein